MDYTKQELERDLDLYRALNTRLQKLQDKIIPKLLKMDQELKKREEDESDPLQAYQLDMKITFYLKEDDKEYDKSKDNILVFLEESNVAEVDDELKDSDEVGDQLFWGNKRNHNEFYHWDHPMKGDWHCWLFHCLYDHTHLWWQDLLRIGRIEFDIKPCYEYEYEMK